MATRFEIEEHPDRLLLISRYKEPRWMLLAKGCVWASVVCCLLRNYYAWPFILGLFLITAVAGMLLASREQTVVLCISKLEAQVKGPFRGGYEPNRYVPLAEIERLEYREQSGGGECAYQPKGLFAELPHGSTCLLPNIAQAEAELAIEAIYSKFPQIPLVHRPARSLPFGDPIISLKLEQPPPS